MWRKQRQKEKNQRVNISKEVTLLQESYGYIKVYERLKIEQIGELKEMNMFLEIHYPHKLMIKHKTVKL